MISQTNTPNPGDKPPPPKLTRSTIAAILTIGFISLVLNVGYNASAFATRGNLAQSLAFLMPVVLVAVIVACRQLQGLLRIVVCLSGILLIIVTLVLADIAESPSPANDQSQANHPMPTTTGHHHGLPMRYQMLAGLTV